MLAARVKACRQIEIIELPTPTIDGAPPGTMLVKTARASICGSDLPHFTRSSATYPLQPGLTVHECMGVVVASRSDRYEEGDEVVALPRPMKGLGGGLAEYFFTHESVAVPALPFERPDCILMSQPLGTVLWGLRRLPNLVGRDVVVVGQGAIGLLMTRLLAGFAPRKVIAVDLLDYRLELAATMHATRTINAQRTDVRAAIAAETEGRGADVVVEAVGHQSETLELCVDLVAEEGRILAFGVPDDPSYAFPFERFFRKNARMAASQKPDPEVFALAMDLIRQRRIDVGPLLTTKLPLADAQRGFELFERREEGVVKIVFQIEELGRSA